MPMTLKKKEDMPMDRGGPQKEKDTCRSKDANHETHLELNDICFFFYLFFSSFAKRED